MTISIIQYELLTKFGISQSVLGQFAWSKAAFEGVVKGYKRPVLTSLTSPYRLVFCSLLFSNLKDQDCWSSLFPVLVQSSLSLFIVPRLDFQALRINMNIGHR